MEELLRAGNTHVVDVDIKGCLDTIPHDRLMALVREHIADGRVLGLIEGFLKQGVIEGENWQEAKERTPQGGVISPLLALHPDKTRTVDMGLADSHFGLPASIWR